MATNSSTGMATPDKSNCPCSRVATAVPPISPAKVPAERCSERIAVSARYFVWLETMKAVITAQYQHIGDTMRPMLSAMAQANVTWIGNWYSRGTCQLATASGDAAGGELGLGAAGAKA